MTYPLKLIKKKQFNCPVGSSAYSYFHASVTMKPMIKIMPENTDHAFGLKTITLAK
jgi:hypothetical protein